MKLDLRAVATGAVITLAIVLPVVFVARGLGGDGAELLVVLALFFGYPAGGFGAARVARRRHYGHAMAVTVVSWGVTIPITFIRKGVNLAESLTLVTMVMVTMAAAMGGGHLALRKQQQEERKQQPEERKQQQEERKQQQELPVQDGEQQ